MTIFNLTLFKKFSIFPNKILIQNLFAKNENFFRDELVGANFEDLKPELKPIDEHEFIDLKWSERSIPRYTKQKANRSNR